MKYIPALRKAMGELKPETRRLLRLALPLLLALYACAVFIYAVAGSTENYQLAMLAAQHLTIGLKSAFGVLCLGLLFFECR